MRRAADHDGVICVDEFESGVRALGLDVSTSVIEQLFSEWDRDESGSLTLAELTSVLHGTATITDLRAHLAKSGTRLTEFFKMLDDGDGLLTCDEFRAAMRKTGFTSVDAIGIDHLFRQLDRDGSGEITFRELRTALEQSVKAEQATNARVRMMRHETPVKVVDLGDVRYEVQRRLRVMAAEVDLKAANLAQHGGKDVAPKGAKDRWRWAKERKAAQDGKRRAVFEKESVHMRLRLRGTELEPGQRDDGGFASELHTAPNSPSRAVTRHGRLPSVNLRNLDGDRWNSQTSKLAILAAHRRRSHAPAQRHCRVLLPPDPSRGKRQLHKSQSQYGSTSPKLPAISPTRTSAGSNCSSSDDKTSPPSNTPSFQSRSRVAAAREAAGPQRSRSMPELHRWPELWRPGVLKPAGTGGVSQQGA